MNKKIRNIGIALLVAAWLVLTAFAWFSPAKEMSDTERRALAQFPTLNVETLLSADFMSKFETYTLDQFPLRDTFRQIKALFHYNVYQQMDNNDIYIADDYAAKLEPTLDEASLAHAMERFNWIHDKYLTGKGGKIFCALIPDKSFYLAEENGYLSMDYDKLFASVKENMTWAEHIDITDTLDIGDYYYTDHHWRQEHLIPTAQKLCAAMGVTAPKSEDFTKTKVDRDFYGVYYGQAALPLPPEDLYIMESELLKDCKVFDYESNAYAEVYDMTKLDSKDLYDVFLSGPRSLLRIENPNAATDKELIIFRDSFGSAFVPLLVQDYKTVTLVDIRYIGSQMLDRFITIEDQDILFLYSTLVLNSAYTLK